MQEPPQAGDEEGADKHSHLTLTRVESEMQSELPLAISRKRKQQMVMQLMISPYLLLGRQANGANWPKCKLDLYTGACPMDACCHMAMHCTAGELPVTAFQVRACAV